MTTDELHEMFENFRDEYLKFERIERPAHRRPDVCAFIMLDAAVEKRARSGKFMDMVSHAEHDEIYLDIGPDDLAKVATEELVRDLVRCGVRYCGEYDCLAMFA